MNVSQELLKKSNEWLAEEADALVLGLFGVPEFTVKAYHESELGYPVKCRPENIYGFRLISELAYLCKRF